MKNQAETYANEIVPIARGAAKRAIQDAEGYKAKVIAEAEGEATRFDQLLSEHHRKLIKTTMVDYHDYNETLHTDEHVGGEKQWMFGQMNASKFFDMDRYSFEIHNIKLKYI